MPNSNGRFSGNECGPAWPMPAKTANAWAGHSQQPSTPTRYESSSVPASANPKSPADYILEELPCAASWSQSKPRSGRPNEVTHPSRKLTLNKPALNDVRKSALIGHFGHPQFHGSVAHDYDR